MMVRTRFGLIAWCAAASVTLAACGSGDSPTSPSSDSTAQTGAVIEGTVSSGGGVSSRLSSGVPGGTASGPGAAATSPMAGLTVSVVGTNLTATVGNDGTFRLTEVPGGMVRLRFTGSGVDATASVPNVNGEQFIQITIQISGTTAVVVADDRDHKVSLCHAEGNGTYHLISIAESAEASHRNHGDAKVGEVVPGRAPMTFNERCEVVGPDIEIEKSTNGEDADSAPGPRILVGAAVTWTYLVTNTGTVPLTTVAVVDDQAVTVTCGQTTLAPGASMTCTGTGTAVLGQYRNVGTVTANWSTTTGSGTISDDDPSHYLGYVEEDEEEGPKVTLCHRTGAGFFVRIEVGLSAEPAHLAHGDGRPGGAVPGQPGRAFTSSCGVQ